MKDKDFFYHLFKARSSFSYCTYSRNFLQKLPLRLLDHAALSAPEIKTSADLKEAYQHLATRCSDDNETWRNSELYPYINYLTLPGNAKLKQCVDAILVHCGLRPLTAQTNPEVKFWRICSCRTGVQKIEEKTILDVPDISWSFQTGKNRLRVYAPCPGLFDDIEPRLYGIQSSNRSISELERLLINALDIIKLYSDPMYNRMIENISTIAFLKERTLRPVSFSLRNLFIGAVFISIASLVEIAEQLIHEYYHQSIWPWWLVEGPADMPDVNVTVRSPITGATRPIATMIQALLIYESLLDFYSYVLASDYFQVDERERAKAVERVRVIQTRIGDLSVLLRNSLMGRPETLSMVDEICRIRDSLSDRQAHVVNK